MTETDANMRGLRREWLAARVFAIVGGLLVIAICVLVVISGGNNQARVQQAALQRHADDGRPVQRADWRRPKDLLSYRPIPSSPAT